MKSQNESILSILRRNAATFSGISGFDPEKELKRCEQAGINLLIPSDARFHPLLSQISDPPLVLYVLGALASDKSLAVVGSRKPTLYGRRMARSLAEEMARRSMVSVSGLARGIDTEIHEATLGGEGITWAVLGSGLERVYPSENKRLAERIVSGGGAVISEAPLDAPPSPENFPRRNRVISGLSWATIVVEGHAKSGALITARNALDQGRDVFAVPGPVDSMMSEGPNKLIKTGAASLITGWDDIFEQLPPIFRNSHPRPAKGKPGPLENCAINADERRIIQMIGSNVVALDVLIKETGWSVDSVTSILLELEVKGLIQSSPGQQYSLC